jgi:glycosyltransferase involved in cell wall biosynthesis
MDVILNIGSLQPPITGIGNYTLHLLRGLQRNQHIKTVTCFSGMRWLAGGELEKYPGRPIRNGHLPVWGKEIVRALPFAQQMYSVLSGRLFYHHARACKDSIYHEPGYLLKPFKGCAITTVHDLSHLRFPQHHPAKRVKHLVRNLEKTLSRAAHIITDSQFTKKELIGLMGVDAARITAIPLGVDPAFRPRDKQELQPVLSGYRLAAGEYLLSVGTLEPRKNINGLLDAYLLLDDKLRRRFPLVLAGSVGWKSADLVQRIGNLEQRGQVRRLNYVPADDLPFLYAGARGFVFPSLYEGFGLPPLEAMASGVPTLVSECASLPEVVGDAGLYAEPGDTDALSRAKLFSWEDCVDKTVAVYRQVAG